MFLRNSILLVLISLGLITGCTTFPSVNQDPAKNNQTTFTKDLGECKEDYPELGSGVNIRQWISCMRLKGWR